MKKAMVAVSCCAFLAAGCSAVRVTHVDDQDKSEGVHFYEPRPYLLVTQMGNDENTLTNQIIWLPDHSQRYKVTFESGWGSVNGSVKLQNGWMLDTLGAQTDSKIPETISAFSGLVAAAVPKGITRVGATNFLS